MKIIFGLGNPGCEYVNTRHNMGFNLLDYLYKDGEYKKKFNAEYAEINISGEKVLLVKPMKFINLSGEVVRDYINYFKVGIDDILIIHDDLDMPLGNIKLTYNHSSGGHNGIKNIEQNLNTKEYLRLKIGISNNKTIDTKDYVLGKLDKEDKELINQTFSKLSNLFDDYVLLNKNDLMNKYNGLND